jgi:hypothetical protein
VCTNLLRFAPGTRWPVLLGAVRDEFVDRPWDPPAAFWPDHPHLIGGRDRVAGGTWLAVDPTGPAFAAVLNGRPVEPPLPDEARRSRGDLPLRILTGALPDDLTGYERFHLVRATLDRLEVWSWDRAELTHQSLAPGDHIIVNDGVDAEIDPLVPYVRPVLAAAATPDPVPGHPAEDAWGDWLPLLDGGGLDPGDPRALLIRFAVADRVFGSTSVSLVALGADGVRYDFSDNPGRAATWKEIAAPR